MLKALSILGIIHQRQRSHDSLTISDGVASRDDEESPSPTTRSRIKAPSSFLTTPPETPTKAERTAPLPLTPISLPRNKRKVLVVEIPLSSTSSSSSTSKLKRKRSKSETDLTVVTKTQVLDSDDPHEKILLLQERVRHDPWKLLVATSLLNVTSGRAARPIFWQILERWPTPTALAEADYDELSTLLYPLGLYQKRALSLIKFSFQYIQHDWPLFPPHLDASHPTIGQSTLRSPSRSNITTPTTSHDEELRKNVHEELKAEVTDWDVKIFHGSGVYASDSFRIYSPLLPGRGGPEDEQKWTSKRERARVRAVSQVAEEAHSGGPNGRRHRRSAEGDELGVGGEDLQELQGTEGSGPLVGSDATREEVDAYLSDEEGDNSNEEWRKVRPKDKELRRYLIYRWNLEGITYDIHTGPKIVLERDRRRLSGLL